MKTRGLASSSLLLREIHGDEAHGLGDLNRCEPDTGRVVHRFEHVVGKLAQLRRDFLDRPGNESKLFVRKDDDFANSHGARCNPGSCLGQSWNARCVNRWLTMFFSKALTINVPSSFAFSAESR